MELALRIFIYMIVISIVRSVLNRRDKINIENTVIILPLYSKILKICALILIALAVLIGMIFILFSSIEDRSGFLVVELIFSVLILICLIFALYIDNSRIVFDDEKLIARELFVPQKEIFYTDITSCEIFGNRYVVKTKTRKRVNVDLGMINSDVLLNKIKKSGVSVENNKNHGYFIKPKLPIICLLLIFLSVAIWIDVGCIMQDGTIGFNAILFTSIAPAFLIIFCKERYYVKNNKLTRKLLFWDKDKIDISAISRIEERKDFLEGRHLMIYLSGHEKPVFDIDSSYMNTYEFEEDMKKRNKYKK
ncbi:hypothetical protein [Pseudobutyrivibrio ruminis]|uniref:hypothetical protein n=1 Tax=Pseudobutyrivibrio ruminis TaxID=46206 RepID=UPI0003FD6172|nr:hypothetical protein [Pseudobutyrivibrio ruminis]